MQHIGENQPRKCACHYRIEYLAPKQQIKAREFLCFLLEKIEQKVDRHMVVKELETRYPSEFLADRHLSDCRWTK